MHNSDAYFNTFQKYLIKNGVLLDLKHTKNLVKRYLAAEFARQLYGDDKYYEIVLKEDAMIKAVLERK
ncbi:hypothetical protein D9M70_586910 [compost metagenome]